MPLLKYDISGNPPERFEIQDAYREIKSRTQSPEYTETTAGQITMCAPPLVDIVVGVVTAPLAIAEMHLMGVEKSISNIFRETDTRPYEYASTEESNAYSDDGNKVIAAYLAKVRKTGKNWISRKFARNLTYGEIDAMNRLKTEKTN